jgi:hypothetical protein
MTKRKEDQIVEKFLYCAKERLLMHVHPLGRHSLRELAVLKDAFTGKRCFVIGNGPSLRQTDMSLLRNESTFGLNRIYLLFPQMGFPTTFLVSINRLVLQQVGSELLDFSGPLFVPWSSRKYAFHTPPANLRFLLTGCGSASFNRDVRGALWSGATVTYIALQLAFHMGFEQVILIGVDHSFSTQGPAHTEVTSTGDDPNHFSPNYFGKGFRWQLPDLEASERAYKLARTAYEQAGREVLDATIGGKLQVFPKVDYLSLF